MEFKVHNLTAFLYENKVEIKEALENHIEEIKSMCEGADDDEYIFLNNKRSKILKRLVKLLS